jgi:hypothetical protein
LKLPGGIRGYETILPLLRAASNEADVRDFTEASRTRSLVSRGKGQRRRAVERETRCEPFERQAPQRQNPEYTNAAIPEVTLMWAPSVAPRPIRLPPGLACVHADRCAFL